MVDINTMVIPNIMASSPNMTEMNSWCGMEMFNTCYYSLISIDLWIDDRIIDYVLIHWDTDVRQHTHTHTPTHTPTHTDT